VAQSQVLRTHRRQERRQEHRQARRQESDRLTRIVLAVTLLGLACAATRSGPSRKQQEYLKAHPLSPDEERRLFAREAKLGDTIDRVRVTCDDCNFEPAASEGDLSLWAVHVPIDARPFRLFLQKLDEVQPGGDAQLTFQDGKLKSALIF
jgi:hypothetical protein